MPGAGTGILIPRLPTPGVTIGLHGASVIGIDPTELADSVFNNTPKRGKDIKCFEDLPPDVQRTIDMMSIIDGKIDETIKTNRTAIAIHYQLLFPDYSDYWTGIAI